MSCSKKIAVLIGTRPGIIKMSPIIHELRSRQIPNIVIHTGQHYSDTMDKRIMESIGLSDVDYHLNRPENCVSHAEQTAYMLVGIEKILLKEKPDVFLVCGDANTNMAGALASRKIHIKVGHVEAGLRSFDWRMPEEHNRIIIDHISEYLFSPTILSKKHLEDDGVNGKIFVVGNTIVDSTLTHSKIAEKKGLEKVFGITEGKPYFILTFHREENVDNKNIVRDIIQAVSDIVKRTQLNVVFPMHPRTQKRIKEFGLENELMKIKRLKIIEPLTYLDFINFLKNAKVVLTDSGGVQEEACILKIPCITLRESTERQETVTIGANHVVGTNADKIYRAFNDVLSNNNPDWKNPYGDGKASKRIVDTCLNGYPEDEFLYEK